MDVFLEGVSLRGDLLRFSSFVSVGFFVFEFELAKLLGFAIFRFF
jgi:hypothetical protein